MTRWIVDARRLALWRRDADKAGQTAIDLILTPLDPAILESEDDG